MPASFSPFFRRRAVSLALAFLSASSPVAIAQQLQLIRSDRTAFVTYSTTVNTVGTVQTSLDLLHWSQAETSDQLVGQSAGGQTFSCAINIGTVPRLFFRLQLANAWNASLAWNSSAGPEAAGYCLHYGIASHTYNRHIDVGNATKAKVSLPLAARLCYFAVTAYNSAGIEGFPSKELKIRRANH